MLAGWTGYLATDASTACHPCRRQSAVEKRQPHQLHQLSWLPKGSPADNTASYRTITGFADKGPHPELVTRYPRYARTRNFQLPVPKLRKSPRLVRSGSACLYCSLSLSTSLCACWTTVRLPVLPCQPCVRLAWRLATPCCVAMPEHARRDCAGAWRSRASVIRPQLRHGLCMRTGG